MSAPLATPKPGPRKLPTLVVLQLTGGNDPLNSVVPYGNPLYFDHRRSIGLDPDSLLRIDDTYGFNPSMATLEPFYDDGKMAIINGIGYPNPDYSHFRSLDIWYTCDPDSPTPMDGWLGKVVREMDPTAENVLTAVHFGRGVPRALALDGVPVASVAALDSSYGLLSSLASVSERQTALEVFSRLYDDGWEDQGHLPDRGPWPDGPVSEVLRYMGRTGLDAQKGADILRSALDGYSSTIEYPETAIGASLKGIAQVKLADLGTRIFYTSHGNFDTHEAQLKIQNKLLREVSEAVAAFFADLRQHDAADDVVMLLFTEFGRRVRDNGTGTDHGAAGTAFLIGDPVRGGMYGEYPSLRPDDCPIGNLKMTVDFRQAYATILEQWLQIEAPPIVRGRFEQFPILPRSAAS
jgi:uncharacterized protein (DUF1501 family)